MILCTKTDEARARVVTPIISDEGESANLLDASRFESYRCGTGGSPLPPTIYVVADCSSSSRLLLPGFIGKFPYLFF